MPSGRSESEIRAYTVGQLKPLSGRIRTVDYDPQWPAQYSEEAEKIRSALGPRALRVEHTGSTSVPGLAAKPIIDVLSVVADSANEDTFVPALEGAGYVLRIREPDWHKHRMFNAVGREVNLHVFSMGCPEIERVLMFRDWLRRHADDRDLYANTKLELAREEWKHVQNYADAKTAVIEEILTRAQFGINGRAAG